MTEPKRSLVPPGRGTAWRTARAVRILVRDRALPRWLRGLAVIGLAPVPGPFDELVVVVVGVILWVAYRDRMRAAWRAAARTPVRDATRP
jgi:hypothetical protein